MTKTPSAVSTSSSSTARVDGPEGAASIVPPSILPALDRLEWLLLLTALVVVVLAYPLRLQDAWQSLLLDYWERSHTVWSRWTRAQFEPFLSSAFSPLILKGVLAAIPLLGFMAVRLARRLLTPVLRPAAERGRVAPQPEPAGRWAWLSIAAFFGWMALSALWSPTPLLARDVLVWTLLFGLFTFILFRRGLTRSELTRLGVLLMALGAVVMSISFFEALPIFRGKIFLIFNYFPDMRNRYGSLLGHNTAAASFLMMTAFPAFAFLLTARTVRRRVISGVYLAVLLYAELILQSRAIWVFLPVLGLLALRSALRQLATHHTRASRLRRLPPILLAILAVCLLTQVVDRPWNPFFIRDNPLARRLKDLSYAGLKGEARVRLNVIGIRLVPEHPLTGHGLYAFQYVYPKIQGEYLNSHPDSWLNQTLARSNMAHNEYLQVLIDQGVIGLGLLVWMLGEMARRGWRRRAELGDVAERLQHEAFGWSALGFALHALVDFPWHLPQIGLPGLLCLAAWGAYRSEMAEPQPEATSELPEPVATFRLGPFLRLLGAFMLLLAVPLATQPLANALQADVYFIQGGQLLRALFFYKNLTPQEQERAARQAVQRAQQAVQLQPAHYLARQVLTEACLQLGTIYAQQTARPDAAPYAERAREWYKRGLRESERTLEGLRYHAVYYDQAQLYQEMAGLEPNGPWRARYENALVMALRYCPSFSEANYALTMALEANGAPDDLQRAFKLRQALLSSQPYEFTEKYVKPAYKHMENLCYFSARRDWERILACDPGRAEWLVATGMAEMMAGDRTRALERFTEVRRRDPMAIYYTGASILEAALKRDWMQLLIELSHSTMRTDQDQAYYRAIEDETRRRVNWTNPIYRFTKPEKVSEEQWQWMIADARPKMYFYIFDDLPAARQAMEERRALGGQSGHSLDFWIEGVYLGLVQHDLAFAADCLAQARALKPDHPAIRELESRLKVPAAASAQTAPRP